MSELLDRLESRLKQSGWIVTSSREGNRDENNVRPIYWMVESRVPPLGVLVEVHLRLMERLYWYYDDALTGASIRYPQADANAPVEFEANLVGDEVTTHDFRSFIRALQWFRDPLSHDYWQEQAEGDWQPPVEWLARRWGAQATLEPRWNVCADGQEMLRSMPAIPSDRKLRLIACACCRLLALPMLHERNVAAIESAERYADQLCPRREMKKACKHSELPWLAQLDPLPLALQAIRLVGDQNPGKSGILAANVVREIIGNPFQRVEMRRRWLREVGAAVSHLVETIAADRCYQDMPILADALEDAGCAVPAILDHCRQSKPHLNGCWVLDILRGRS